VDETIVVSPSSEDGPGSFVYTVHAKNLSARPVGTDGTVLGRVAPPPGAPETLLAYLAERLPRPMVPQGVSVVSSFPTTPNGKIDRRALAAQPVDAPAARSHPAVPPRTAVERTVADIWRAVLRIRDVGVHDDFFEMGGTSLTFVDLYEHVDAAFPGLVSLIDLFEEPTAAAAAQLISSRSASAGSAESPIARFEF